MNNRISRRDFLKLSGLAGGGLVLAVYLEACASGTATPTIVSVTPEGTATPTPPFDWQPRIFIQLDQDGILTFTAFRSEMGQGIRTALAMLAAEELDIDWSSVRIIQADADSRFWNQQTGGSVSVSTYYSIIRQAGATARQMLVESLLLALADKVDAGYIQLVCVDSVDTESWYNRNAPPAYRVRRHDDYDRYLRHELAPYVARRIQVGVFFSQTDVFTNVLRKCPGGSTAPPPFYTGDWTVDGAWASGWNCWIGANFGLGNSTANPLTAPFFYGILGKAYNPPLKITQIRKAAEVIAFMDTLTHYVYSPVQWKFARDADHDGPYDSMSGYPTTPFNYARPTVHSGGANLTLLDGRVELVSFKKLWALDGSGNVAHRYWYIDGSH